MRANSMPLLVVIEQRSTSQDVGGGILDTWTTFQTVYAGTTAMSGRELEAAQAVNNEVMHKWTFRYLPGLVPAMRINYGGQYFNILWVDNLGFRNRTMMVYTAVGLAKG